MNEQSDTLLTGRRDAEFLLHLGARPGLVLRLLGRDEPDPGEWGSCPTQYMAGVYDAISKFPYSEKIESAQAAPPAPPAAPPSVPPTATTSRKCYVVRYRGRREPDVFLLLPQVGNIFAELSTATLFARIGDARSAAVANASPPDKSHAHGEAVTVLVATTYTIIEAQEGTDEP